MNDSMRELSPKPTESISSGAVEASATRTVSNRFEGLGEKAKAVAKTAGKRALLTASGLSLILASGCGNTETLGNEDVKVTILKSSQDVSVKVVPAESDDLKVKIVKAETEEEKIAREKAESLFPGIRFQRLKAEVEPIISRFSEEDGKWKGKKAQGYLFEAHKGQRLTTIAEEVEEHSYIQSDLYNDQGELVSGDLDTRVEFVAPKTGTYYVVVGNFKNGVESYNMHLEDRDRSSIAIKIRDVNGNEYFFAPEDKKLPEVKFLDFGLVIDTNNVINPDLVLPVVYALPGTQEEFNKKAFFPEDSPKNVVPTKVTRLDDGRLFVEPVNGLFPDKSQITMFFSTGPNSGYIHRMFTSSQR